MSRKSCRHFGAEKEGSASCVVMWHLAEKAAVSPCCLHFLFLRAVLA